MGSMHMFREDNFIDLRPPKSPRRFFAAAFSPLRSLTQVSPNPPPPVPNIPLPLAPAGIAPYTPTRASSTPRKSHTPSSSTSSFGHVLGSGAQVVRTPSDALKGMQQPVTPVTTETASGPAWTSTDDGAQSPTPPNRPPRPQRSHIAQPSFSRPIAPGGAIDRPEIHKDSPPDSPPCASPTSSSPSPSLSALSVAKKAARKSLSPSPRLQNDLGHMSAFDPFGLGDTVHSTAREADQREVTKKSMRGTRVPEGPAVEERRATIKPPVRPMTSSPFHTVLKAKTMRPAPTSASEVLVTLEFGYSLDDPPKNTSVCLPWRNLAQAGGHLAAFVRQQLGEEEDERSSGVPEMTDGSSAESSDRESESYDLNGLLRDEYLKSLWISSPSQLEFPLPPPLPPVPARRSSINPKTGKKRAATRNQYIQQAHFPSPGSTFASPVSLAARRHAPEPKVHVEEVDGGGTITELTLLITRDAAVYHLIAARLALGEGAKMDGAKRKRVEDECRWLGMNELADEMAELRGKSMVLRGGTGYI